MTGLGTLEPLARAGFLVKGVIYLVIGTLALQVAAREGGRVTGTRGALLTVLGQPFGRTLLLAAAIGLFGYAAWRILQGVIDPERYGRGWKGIAIRIGFVARGVMHAALGWQARLGIWPSQRPDPTRDLTGDDDMPLTQEFLSQMLGVRRTSVSLAASRRLLGQKRNV